MNKATPRGASCSLSNLAKALSVLIARNNGEHAQLHDAALADHQVAYTAGVPDALLAATTATAEAGSEPPRFWTRLSADTFMRMEALRQKFPVTPTISEMLAFLVETGLDHIDARAAEIKRSRGPPAAGQRSKSSEPSEPSAPSEPSEL